MGDFKFGNKSIASLYYGNMSVAAVYYGNQLIWQSYTPVPYDNTCTLTIALSQDQKSWIVTVTKDGEDVTSSLASMDTYIYNANNVIFRPYTVNSNIVDLSSFGRGEYRLDVKARSKAGGSTPNTGTVPAPDYIYIGGGNNLVAGNQNVAIEYDLTNAQYNVTVNSLEIFTDSSTSSTARIKIIHESGLYIAAVDGDTLGVQETKFGLTGYSHSVDNLSVTLYKGHKYYIVYQGSTNEAFYPSRFENENGNYKVYANTQQATSITPYPNISNLKTFLPASGRDLTETDLKTILDMSANDIFLWYGNNTASVLVYGHIAKKSISTPNAVVTTNDSDIWNYTADTYFVWHNKNNQATQCAYKKTTTTSKDGEFTITGSNEQQHISLLLALENDAKRKVLISAPDHIYNNYIGQLFKLKTGYSSDSSLSTTPLTSLPTQPTDKHFYYIAGGYDIWGDYNHNNTSVYVYENGAYTAINAYAATDMLSYIDTTELSTVTEQIAFNTLVEDVQSVSTSEDFINASLNTDKHFYLKVNGMEV